MDGKWNWISVNGSPVKSSQSSSPHSSPSLSSPQMTIQGDEIEFNYGGEYEGHILMEDGHIKFKIKGMKMSVGIEPPIEDVLNGFEEIHRYNVRSGKLRLFDDESKVVMEFEKA